MSFRVEIDFQRDGSYAEAIDDVTAYVYGNSAGSISLEYGRDMSSALAPTVAGRGSLVLNNSTKRFTSRNTSSPLYGLIKPARPVRISRTIEGGSYPAANLYPASTLFPGEVDSVFYLFRGHTDDTPLNPDPNSKTVQVGLVDFLADFKGVDINIPLHSGVRTGDAIGIILDAVGWTGPRDLDAGATVIRYWWVDNKDALTALEELIRSEGPPALLTVGDDGGVVFKDRHHRFIDADTLTSQQTWSSSSASRPTIHRDGFEYDEAWSKIVNTGTASVDVRVPREQQDVWTSEETITLVASESRQIIATSSDPFYAAVTPVDGTDYESVTGTVTVSLSQVAGASTTITVTAVAGAAIIRNLKLRAKPLQTAYSIQAAATDVASIADYGQRSFPGDLPWCNPYDAQAILSTTVEMRAQPLSVVTARFVVGEDETQYGVIGTDLSERVTIDVPEVDLDADFYVENIRHEATGEHDHVVTFSAEAAPVFPTPVFRFDTAGAGFDDGKFATLSVEPATIFLFDGGAGHRFGEGLLAA